tara:strand:+ start:12036 stop:12434 length:399 start_codon:yes stop_codon:yes gene_type:complete
MQRQLKQVEQFNKSFDVVINEEPTFLDKPTFDLGVRLLKEELQEYVDAHDEGDMVEVGDGLVDILFITVGLVIKHGLQDVIVELFDEVFLSNQSKLENGKVIRREDNKILKGKSYFKPAIRKILEKKYGKKY